MNDKDNEFVNLFKEEIVAKDKYVIFSIDNWNDPRTYNQFVNLFNDAVPDGNLLPVIGSYFGQVERSFICLWSDFERIVLRTGIRRMIAEQESVLCVTECNKQYATLWFLNQTVPYFVSIGSLKQVPPEQALTSMSWTFRPDLNQYWITVQGNPDTVYGGTV